MNISDAGLDLIKKFEGLRLSAYQDSVGVWTIGYGHTGNVQAGDVITEPQAEDLLRIDVRDAEKCVDDHVTVPLNQSQFDALTSFIFNLGCGAFSGSTLLRDLNAGDYDGAANQFGRWVHAGNDILAGLVKRRAEERDLFLV